MELNTNAEIDLERPCWNCKGKGCEFCGQVGYMKSDLGDELIAFIRHHAKEIRAILELESGHARDS